ncbi:integral membrane protein [Ktedonobacteria bacterium brp13]|nr:integral membrane protein [Ktedonobacteria bacterium brp13]
MLHWLSMLGEIILIDLVLSGDNALVIGAAASGLPRRQRLWAIVGGGFGAIVLRILFTALAAFLFQIPFLGVIGAAILLYIAIHLLTDRSKEVRKTDEEKQLEQLELSQRGSAGFMTSLLTILLADATMSLDNVLAVGALAEGEILFLAIGLTISICLLLVGSAIIAELINHLPWLLDVACLILAYTAAQILLGDNSLDAFFATVPWLQYVAPAVALLLVLGVDIFVRRRDREFQRKQRMA